MPRRITEKTELVPAAQYLRMSTEHQQYSFANQRIAIAEYATRNGYRVVSTYEDFGKSGLAIRHRDGLKQLLHDVTSYSVAFRAVLVYDISRWGRFQDNDEAAHYEFLCRRAGVPVHYCAEHFEDDLSVGSAVMKALKRSMAGEYSRELSSKVHKGQRQSALNGFRAGGIPGYGLRRLAVSEDGTARRVLTRREFKPFVRDRVTLVLGPSSEVAVVRHIYRTFLQGRGKVGFSDIANELNQCGTKSDQGGRWTPFTVREVLRNPKYAGVLVWPKSTQKLRTKARPTPKQEWIVDKDAYEPIIDQRTFSRAQSLFKLRANRAIPKAELIRSLKTLLAKQGHLSASMLEANKGKYAPSTYLRRLGTMQDIYALLNLDYSSGLLAPRPLAHATTNSRNLILLQLVRRFPSELRALRFANVRQRANLLLDGNIKIFVWTAVRHQTNTGKPVWILRPPKSEKEAPVLLCTMKPGNDEVESIYFFSKLDLPKGAYRIRTGAELLQGGNKLANTPDLCTQIRRLLSASETCTEAGNQSASSLAP